MTFLTARFHENERLRSPRLHDRHVNRFVVPPLVGAPVTRRDVRQAGLGTGVSLALDFIRIHCAVHNRKADDRVLPLETDQGIGVMVNVPFGRTRVFQNVRGKPVPDWTKELETAVKVAA